MANYDPSKIIILLTTGQLKINIHSHSFPNLLTNSEDAHFTLSSISIRGTITYASKKETNGKQPS